MPIVLVELPAADAADVNASALIAACSSGLRRGSCATEELPNGERATAVAIVVWLDPEHLRARIDVGRRAEQRGGWQARELTFHAQDAMLERWRSLGLAIAGVVGEATLLEPAKPVVEQAPALRQPTAAAQAAPKLFRVALGPTLETGLSAERPGVGGWLDLGWRWPRAKPFELAASASNAWSVRETAGLASRFTTFGVGVSGTREVSESIAVRASLLAVLEGVDASATDPSSRAHQSGARWLFGGLGRVAASWPTSGAISGVLGLEIIRLSGETALQVHDRTLELSPAWRAAAQGGLECKF